jgi:hypothetical protein
MTTPIDNQPSYYVNGLELARASTTTLTVASGRARNSTNQNDIILSSSLTLDAATNGANGLDTGSLANSTFYFVFVIGSSQNLAKPATLLSTSATAPILPYNYDVFLRIGCALTNGSAQFLAMRVYGNGTMREYRYDALITELSAQGSATFAAVDMASSVPSTARLVALNYTFVPNTAGNSFSLRTTGSSEASAVFTAPGNVIAPQAVGGFVTMDLNSARSLDYKTTEATDDLTLQVMGFVDFI